MCALLRTLDEKTEQKFYCRICKDEIPEKEDSKFTLSERAMQFGPSGAAVEAFADIRLIHDAQDWPRRIRKCNQDTPCRCARDIPACAIDRIKNPG